MVVWVVGLQGAVGEDMIGGGDVVGGCPGSWSWRWQGSQGWVDLGGGGGEVMDEASCGWWGRGGLFSGWQGHRGWVFWVVRTWWVVDLEVGTGWVVLWAVGSGVGAMMHGGSQC